MTPLAWAILGIILACLVIWYFQTNQESRKPEILPTQPFLYKVGDTVTVKRDGYGVLVIRKGMRGIITEIRSFNVLVVRFDGFPIECCVDTWIFTE